MQSVDVAIVGGGMVGLAVACGLQGSGLRVAVLEQRVPEPLAADAPPQLRVSAINAASEKLLTRLGVWQDILSRRASCYHGMEVWDKDSFGHISFDDQSMGYSHLGHIVEKLSDSLRAVEQSAAVVRYHSVGPRRITAGRLGRK
ncbi:putative monooxygenase [Escherichia coli]|uniref:Putative monooxygenase n=1 Tax=Escherichia coli TaxID=562 RepID=A0A376KN78_ECOLX|nr:putative monooxygenase [Escherichia coli]